jgi:hypothetical protein
MGKFEMKHLNKAIRMIYEAKFVIESFAETYRADFDDLSEKAQEGERGMKLNETASELEQLVDSLEGVVSIAESLLVA